MRHRSKGSCWPRRDGPTPPPGHTQRHLQGLQPLRPRQFGARRVWRRRLSWAVRSERVRARGHTQRRAVVDGGQGWAVSWALLLSPPPAALHPRPACVPEVLGCVFRSVGDSEGATSDPWRDPAPAPGNGAGKRCVRVSTPGPKRSPVWEAWRGVTEAGTRPRPGRSPQHAGARSGKAGGATHAAAGPGAPLRSAHAGPRGRAPRHPSARNDNRESRWRARVRRPAR